ncbi:ATP synthase F1 subunit epsilon [Patescibacteria group bacterium]|nr:ATP synthase F1 subunit epsilon [Patescibacteria group bacterium]
MKLKIVTPEKILLEEEVSQVSVSTAMGQITVLPNHLPLVAQLVPGEIVVKRIVDSERIRGASQDEDLMAVSGGLIEILPDQVVILADTAERAHEIDEARAEEARERAEKAMKAKISDAESFALFTAQMEKEMARLKVARKYKKRGIRTGDNQ